MTIRFPRLRARPSRSTEPSKGGVFSQNVALSPGRAFEFSTTAGGQTSTFHVRCLPPIPRLDLQPPRHARGRTSTSRRPRTRTRLRGTAEAPALRGDLRRPRCPGVVARLGRPTDAKLLSRRDPGVVHRGQRRHRHARATRSTAWTEPRCAPGARWERLTDLHDFQMLPNGNALTAHLLRARERSTSPHTAVPARTRPSSTPRSRRSRPTAPSSGPGTARTTSRSAETPTRWWPAHPGKTPPRRAHGLRLRPHQLDRADRQHGRRVVPALRRRLRDRQVDRRHPLEARRNDQARVADRPGDPQWGLPLGGQHFACVLADGTLTMYDNNTYLTAPPRAVRYGSTRPQRRRNCSNR